MIDPSKALKQIRTIVNAYCDKQGNIRMNDTGEMILPFIPKESEYQERLDVFLELTLQLRVYIVGAEEKEETQREIIAYHNKVWDKKNNRYKDSYSYQNAVILNKFSFRLRYNPLTNTLTVTY